ncbi:MAG: long-chain fatty acid--CoA ligase [Nocardioides sp.]|uniref:acyl-CoA synthetase n=1 Tax=Nocardioides sp. TaxID=35761 RepID=UPI003262FAB0
MRLVDYLDKGASLSPAAPCLTTDGISTSYAEVVDASHRIAGSLRARGIAPGDKVAIISANDPLAFTCVFGISRADAVWCPINPRNEAGENRELLDLFDCEVVIFQAAFAPLVEAIRGDLPRVHSWIRLDDDVSPGDADPTVLGWSDFLSEHSLESGRPSTTPATPVPPADTLAMLVGTGGTTGRPKGVMLSHGNLETMTALTLMGYPFGDRPVYLALAPLTHAAGVLCFPILASGGEIVIMRSPDVHAFLSLIAEHRVTHTFLPPTLIYMVLAADELDETDLGSLRCFWYGAAPMSAVRLEEAITRIGPVMAQLFGQTEAPMMIAMMPPADHVDEHGAVRRERLSAVGRPAPLVTVAIMDDQDRPVPARERGEICARSSLVMQGYYKNPEATAEALRNGWLHTGDIGFLDPDGFLHIVDRAKDMFITGGLNVYSSEVEQAVSAHPAVQDCAVVGLPDDKWGERVVAVIQPAAGHTIDAAELTAFVKSRLGSVKAPKQIEVWDDLPRSKVDKVLKTDVKARLKNG